MRPPNTVIPTNSSLHYSLLTAPVEGYSHLQKVTDLLAIFPEGIIVGGFVRDVLQQRPYKDIDILIPKRPTFEQRAAFKQRFCGLELADVTMQDQYEHPEDDERSTVLEGVWKAGHIDVLHVSDPLKRVHDFPESVNKAYLNSEGFHLTPEFQASHTNKVLTYRRKAGLDRLARMRTYFPDYQVVLDGKPSEKYSDKELMEYSAPVYFAVTDAMISQASN